MRHHTTIRAEIADDYSAAQGKQIPATVSARVSWIYPALVILVAVVVWQLKRVA